MGRCTHEHGAAKAILHRLLETEPSLSYEETNFYNQVACGAPSRPKPPIARSATSRGDALRGWTVGVLPGQNTYRMLPGGIPMMRRPFRPAVVAAAAILLCGVLASAP